MARIRTIKPEFFTSETIAGLQMVARLTFIGLWTTCDDAGRCLANPKLIKAALFPLDDKVTAEAVAKCLDELADAGVIELYRSGEDGRVWLQVCSWDEHQVINHRSKVKSPEAREEDPSVRLTGGLPEGSGSTPSGKERKGRERKGREESSGEPPRVQEVFDHWRSVMGKTDATKLDERRAARIRWALANYPIEDVLAAVDGCAASPYHMGQNQDRRRYDDITLILRDASKLEGFRDAARSAVARKPACGQWTDGGDPARLPTVEDFQSGAYQRGPARF